ERAGAPLVISRLEGSGVPYFYRHGLPPRPAGDIGQASAGWLRPHRRGRGSPFSGPGRLRLDHRTLGMDAGARIHGLLADRADRPGRDRDMPVLVVHEVQPFREPGLAGREWRPD